MLIDIRSLIDFIAMLVDEVCMWLVVKPTEVRVAHPLRAV